MPNVPLSQALAPASISTAPASMSVAPASMSVAPASMSVAPASISEEKNPLIITFVSNELDFSAGKPIRVRIRPAPAGQSLLHVAHIVLCLLEYPRFLASEDENVSALCLEEVLPMMEQKFKDAFTKWSRRLEGDQYRFAGMCMAFWKETPEAIKRRHENLIANLRIHDLALFLAEYFIQVVQVDTTLPAARCMPMFGLPIDHFCQPKFTLCLLMRGNTPYWDIAAMSYYKNQIVCLFDKPQWTQVMGAYSKVALAEHGWTRMMYDDWVHPPYRGPLFLFSCNVCISEVLLKCWCTSL